MQYGEQPVAEGGTYDGLASARARGRTGGQKPKLTPRQAKIAKEMYDSGDYTVEEIASEFGVTRPTIYRHIGKLKPAAEAALAERLAQLPTDTRPPPTVEQYDQLLTRRTR